MRLSATLLLALLVASASVGAWGYDPHRFIADHAVDLLPDEVKPLFVKRRTMFTEHAIDPDLWRGVGWTTEPPNHFLDLDRQSFGPDPFEALPRDEAEAVAKFGREFITQQGRLPWRTEEFYTKLQRAFESLGGPSPSPFVLDDVILFSAVLAHYVADGHVPLHAAVNYDGQLTGQSGLHDRWETELFRRNQDRVRVTATPRAPVLQARDFMFDTLLASNRLLAGELAADRHASEGRASYDDEYFARLGDEQWPVVERRLNDSISAVAAVITGAWQRAGRPVVPLELPRTPRPIKRPTP